MRKKTEGSEPRKNWPEVVKKRYILIIIIIISWLTEIKKVAIKFKYEENKKTFF